MCVYRPESSSEGLLGLRWWWYEAEKAARGLRSLVLLLRTGPWEHVLATWRVFSVEEADRAEEESAGGVCTRALNMGC